MFAIVVVNLGCAHWKTTGIVRNGGDTPPMTESVKLARSDLSQLASGEAIAWLHPPSGAIERCSESRVDILAPADTPRKQKTKLEKQKAEKKKGEKEKGEKDKAEKGEKEKGEKEKAEKQKAQKQKARKRKTPDMNCVKWARKIGKDSLFMRHHSAHLGLKDGKDSRRVVYQIQVPNTGNADFSGGVRVIDRIPPGLKDIRVLAPTIRSLNWMKPFLSWVPFLEFFIADWVAEPIDESAAGYEATLRGDLLTLNVKNIVIETKHWLAFEFEATVAPE
jgi:hypothetical protein